MLDACSVQEPDCDKDYQGFENGNCGSPVAAQLYFSTFLMLTFLIIVNMYIAIILENLNNTETGEELSVSQDDIDDFYDRCEPHWSTHLSVFCSFCQSVSSIMYTETPLHVLSQIHRWTEFDVHATQMLPYDHLPSLIMKLPQPLGIPDCDIKDLSDLEMYVLTLHIAQHHSVADFVPMQSAVSGRQRSLPGCAASISQTRNIKRRRCGSRRD